MPELRGADHLTEYPVRGRTAADIAHTEKKHSEGFLMRLGSLWCEGVVHYCFIVMRPVSGERLSRRTFYILQSPCSTFAASGATAIRRSDRTQLQISTQTEHGISPVRKSFDVLSQTIANVFLE